MTLIAGIFSRNPKDAVPDSACEALRGAISRHPGDEVTIFRDARCFLAKVDVGAYGEPAFRVSPHGTVSMLAGEPLVKLEVPDAWRTRTEDLEALHDAWDKGDWSLLQRVSGAFCAVYYEPRTGTLSLIADKLCVRPLYYWVADDYVAFATALRILESLVEIPKEMDLRAITQMVALGLPLGIRTPYAGISLLKAAEIIQLENEKISSSQYWRWDEVTQSSKNESGLVADAYVHFKQAITRRIRRDSATVAPLSGGLDSRCLVGELRGRNIDVHTLNFAWSGAQDKIFAANFAREVGSLHEEFPPFAKVEWSIIMAKAWRDSKLRATAPPERPNLFWSGDGGSVGFGHVYVSKRITELMRAGQKHEATEEFILQQSAHIPEKLLRADINTALSGAIQNEIMEELDDIHSDDPGRSFHIFLLLNDQRRHLALHFEDIDLHRLEFQLPFYDLCIGHKFYSKWLEYLPPSVVSVPWQTYPGHEPCPLPIPDGLLYQWDGQVQKSKKRELLSLASQILRAEDFPRDILNRQYLRMSTLMYRANVRDYGYLIQAASTYQKYWARCGGRYSMNS
jgi:asparagine synthase (glutamine-hydrolysing)